MSTRLGELITRTVTCLAAFISPVMTAQTLQPSATHTRASSHASACVDLEVTDLAAGAVVTWASTPNGIGTLTPSGINAKYCPPSPGTSTGLPTLVTVTATPSSGNELQASIVVGRAARYGGLFQRLIIGAEFSGGAATKSEGRYFTDIFASTPLFRGGNDDFGPLARLWIDARITSVPQQFEVKVSEFSIASGFKDLKVNEVAQAIEVIGGFQIRVKEGLPARLFFEPGLSRTTISLIGAYGGTTPIVPKDFMETFAMPPKGSDAHDRLKRQFPNEIVRRPDANLVAFVPADKERFWRQYYGGVRIESHYYTEKGDFEARPMRTVDLLIGQNEVITGGRWRGSVVRADFFQPFRVGAAVFYIFGTASFKASRRGDSTQEALVLNRPPEGTSVNLVLPTTLLITAPPSNRDFYRIGVGVDLAKILPH